jgi:hypothetical protein
MKKTSFSFVAAIITLALAGGATTATGCGGVSTSSLCGDICACERCTSNDLKACEDSGTKAADAADAAGCTSQFDDAVACASAHVSCKDNRAVSNGCDAELTALTKCSNHLSVLGKNACELAADIITSKLTGCGLMVQPTSSSSGGTAQCTAALGTTLTCQAACVAPAPCSIFVNDSNNPPTSEQTKVFADCITQCQ